MVNLIEEKEMWILNYGCETKQHMDDNNTGASLNANCELKIGIAIMEEEDQLLWILNLNKEKILMLVALRM